MAWTTKNTKNVSGFPAGLPTLPKIYNLIKGLSENIKFYELEAAEVLEVLIDNEDLPVLPDNSPDYSYTGAIKARLIHSEHGVKLENLGYIRSLDSNIKILPIVGEYVIVSSYIGGVYYSQNINLLNSVNHNALPGISDIERDENFTLDFKHNNKITQIQPGIGDIILNGRFGHSIHFGKHEETLAPNIKISVGYEHDNNIPKVENINTDKSSLWIITNEEIKMTPAYDDAAQPSFSGAQIFLNSNRIVFNSKVNELMGFSKTQIYFGAPKFIVNSNSKIQFETPEILVGKDHLTVAETLIEVFEELLDTLMKNQVIPAPPGTPVLFNTGTTFNPIFVKIFKTKLKKILTSNM